MCLKVSKDFRQFISSFISFVIPTGKLQQYVEGYMAFTTKIRTCWGWGGGQQGL